MPTFAASERLSRVLRAEQGKRLAARAVEMGLVSADRVAEAEAACDGGSVVDVLVERGWLERSALARVAAADARRDFARPSSTRLAPPPPEVEAAAAEPERNLGDFVLVAPIARGGTGQVWKAWDRRLGRFVAVKVPSAALDSSAARARFEREALAAGQLAHPHIVPVFQVGVAGDRCFLVMLLVEGEALDQRALPVRQAVEIMRAVALAVEHAHRRGVVHRDLKPGNVLVDRSGHAFVLDFGLAFLKEHSSSRLTDAGQVLGTASYLAPEQARGDRSVPDAATDIYGLGATLYALVAGRAPFTGASAAAVVAQVISSDPRPLREILPHIDPRLDAVVARAMDKDPRRRYPSAAAFADELQRILDDREVEARAPGALQRLRRSVRRHPVLWAAAAFAIIAGLAVGVERLRARRETRAAVETFREMATFSLETALRLRRAGDTFGMRQVLPRLVAAYDQVAARGALSAEVEHLVGRIYRALMDEDRALAHQERALAREPGLAPARYERAVLLSLQYGRQFMDDPRRLGRKLDEQALLVERERPDLAALRRRIIDDLTRLQTLPLGRETADAARGILAYHRRQLREATELLERTLAADPLREEVWDALARTREAEGRLADADATYTRALEHDRGYAPHLAGRCHMRWRMKRWADAVADGTAALALDPDLAGAALCRASARADRGHETMMRGGDPRTDLDEAEQEITRVLARGESADALWRRGTLRRTRALFAMRRGADPGADLDAAAADLTGAIALGPTDPRAWNTRAGIHLERARLRLDAGGDPGPSLAAAEADASEAVRVNDTQAGPWRRRAEARALRALDLARRGQPADEPFAAAERDYDEAQRRGSDSTADFWTRLGRGTLRTWRGRERARQGGDPLPDWAAAEVDLSEAMRLFPDYTDPWLLRAQLRAARGAYLVGHHRAAGRAEITAASADLDQAMAREPQNRDVSRGLARFFTTGRAAR